MYEADDVIWMIVKIMLVTLLMVIVLLIVKWNRGNLQGEKRLKRQQEQDRLFRLLPLFLTDSCDASRWQWNKHEERFESIRASFLFALELNKGDRYTHTFLIYWEDMLLCCIAQKQTKEVVVTYHEQPEGVQFSIVDHVREKPLLYRMLFERVTLLFEYGISEIPSMVEAFYSEHQGTELKTMPLNQEKVLYRKNGLLFTVLSTSESIILQMLSERERVFTSLTFTKKTNTLQENRLIGRLFYEKIEPFVRHLEDILCNVDKGEQVEVSASAGEISLADVQTNMKRMLNQTKWLSDEEVHLLSYTYPRDIYRMKKLISEFSYQHVEAEQIVHRTTVHLYEVIEAIRTNIERKKLRALKAQEQLIRKR